ncbi:hypothetical protein BRC90_03765 [Halobacteriales archaeon QS_4_69_34]|jgi:hypothetical protein|nr:MAG: hypothetical protein BRC90_03765 [Halobacteriales archaeon QS_4_69_34]
MASQGDIRVLLALDLLLSAAFAAGIVRGLDFVGVLAFSWGSVALLAVVIATVTYLVTLR